MKVRSSAAPPSSRERAPLGLVLLGLGVVAGALLDPVDRWRDWVGVATEEVVLEPEALALSVPVAPAPVPETPPENDLRTLHVDLDPEASQRLQEVYERSMRLKHIAQTEGDLVPATIRADGKTILADVRIKGDFLDHLDTDKWSLRIELQDDKLWGMSRFSIQHPKTRGYLWEWLFMEMARREGLLAPRADFVNVVMNGNSTGIYYLEEHFTKELIESQGRREGPIVRFVEDAFLDMEQQYIVQLGYASDTVAPASQITAAEVAAYGEKRFAQSENLARQLQQALDLMRRVQLDREGRETHDLLDLPSQTLHYAFAALFRSSHSTNWKSRRYYHNPVTGRLEPVVFDTGAGTFLPTRDPLEVHQYTSPAYLKNGRFYNAFFEALGRLSEPEYLDGVVADVFPRLRHFEELMRAEGLDDPLLDTAAIEHELRTQAVHLHELVHPRMPVGFDARLLTDDPTAERPAGTIEVEAWCNTRVPVVLSGFRLGNGQFLPAAGLEVRGAGVLPHAGSQGAVVLPGDGTHVVFRFRSDEREAVLRDVNEVKSALLSGGTADKSIKLDLTALSRPITEEADTAEPLYLRKFGATWSTEGGRPSPPSLEEALAAHECLRFDAESGRLHLATGTFDVAGDLVVPSGYVLHAGPGTHLRFGEEHALITDSALVFEGTEEEPVVLGPKAGVPSWEGVAVLQPLDKSVWRHVLVHDTDVIRRGGWFMTGGITFFRAPVDLYDCTFRDAHGEDALNIFAAAFLMDGVVIDGVASDAYDGDFVTGKVVRSTFLNSVEDAVDVSGSDIDVEDCRFVNVGDKAISSGENSVVRTRGCVVESASIGVASKDFSRVFVDGIDIRSTINYGFAVYIKKAEFGPSSVVAKDVTLGTMGRGAYIVQDACRLELEGTVVPTEPVDVAEMYRLKILGQ